jgi:hypothetical protein
MVLQSVSDIIGLSEPGSGESHKPSSKLDSKLENELCGKNNPNRKLFLNLFLALFILNFLFYSVKCQVTQLYFVFSATDMK